MYVNPTEAAMGGSKPDLTEDALQLERLRAIHHETTDPMAARLLGDILTKFEATVGFGQKIAADDEPQLEPPRTSTVS